jgi:hypothetical protein
MRNIPIKAAMLNPDWPRRFQVSILTPTGAATQGLRRTEFNFAGERLYRLADGLPGKIEFCTSEPRKNSRNAGNSFPLSRFTRVADWLRAPPNRNSGASSLVRHFPKRLE